MTSENRNVALLCATQALLFTNNTILIAINGLAGFALAADKSLATLPVTSYVIGAALTTLPVSHLMRRVGRVNGFMIGTLIGILGALICGFAVYSGDFWMLCMGTLIMGIYNASGQYYRFAAADVASTDFKSKAISLVMAGGLVGGVLGPQTSKFTKDLLPAEFLGSYLALIGFCVVALALQRMMDIPRLTAAEQKDHGRPLREIARQPAFLVAVLSGMVGYGVMNLLMTATPLAMKACEHPFSDAAFVIQWHVVAMFAPSFFTGALIKRFGVRTILFTGVLLSLACVVMALSGVEVMHFTVALILIGVGWNFMYLGGTTLLTETHAPSEKAKVQGANDMAIFITMAISSASSGWLFSARGWEVMNYGAVPFLVLTGLAILFFGRNAKPAVA
ncbi:MAG: MFS transporter [Betaproteobacteria bacterium]|nr:MFS transporter [Betaproteobacteria bacterium]MDH5342897.1 MFS transporter [Betaproteobacteria bacterium]